MAAQYDVVIIGGGQAGLVTGYYLQQRNIANVLILDANEDIGGSWQHYWDSVRLFSSARYSSLDGLPFPAHPDYYPNRRDVIAYLQKYAAHFSLPIKSGQRVQTIHQRGTTFEVLTTDGNCYSAKAVISATGPFTQPHIPQIHGHQHFTGQQLHSYDYHKPHGFAGQRIVVVGSNNSAVQVAVELASVADVSLAVRKNIKWTPKRIAGIDFFWFLHDTGFDMLPVGCRFGLCVSDAVYDDGTYQTAVEAGNPDPRPMFTEITPHGVIWRDGTHEAVDTILYATGFRPDNLPYLMNIDALDETGKAAHQEGISTQVDGLFYIGREGLIAPASATLRGVSRDARHISGEVQRYLA